jgi:hypothetical protein
MLLLEDHIKALDELLGDKGYMGYFMSNFGFPGKLQETIRKHFFQSYISNKDVNPINLSTYTRWNNEEDPYVRCDFTVKYDDGKGFSINKMDIHFKNQYGNIRSAEITPRRDHEIPSSEKANSIVEQNNLRRQIKTGL